VKLSKKFAQVKDSESKKRSLIVVIVCSNSSSETFDGAVRIYQKAVECVIIIKYNNCFGGYEPYSLIAVALELRIA